MAAKLNLLLDLDTDDNEFFGSLESKKPGNLESVFGSTITNENENVSLKYQPVKKSAAIETSKQSARNTTTTTTATSTTVTPSSTATTTTTTTAMKTTTRNDSSNGENEEKEVKWLTTLAKVANAYKISESVGKVGIAILEDAYNSIGKLIIYKTKSNVLGSKSLNGLEGSFWKSNSYIQFYDDNNVGWSIFFEKFNDEKEFLEKLRKFHYTIESQDQQQQHQHQKQKQVAIIQSDMEKENSQKSEASMRSHSFDSSKVTLNETKIKKSLVARMARMGQPLPSLQIRQIEDTSSLPDTTEQTDSSGPEEIIIPQIKKPAIQPRAHKLQALREPYLGNSISSYTNCSTATMESQLMQMLLSENRTQNSETRINLSKLESKIEKILDRVESLGPRSSSPGKNKDDVILELEEKVILLKKENRRMKQQLEEKSAAATADKSHNTEILKKFHTRFLSLGLSETNDVEKIIQDLLDRIKVFEESYKCKENENRSKCEELQTSIQQLNKQNTEVIERQNDLQQSLTLLEDAMKLSNTENAALKAELKAAEENSANLEEKLRDESKSTIKAIMNSTHSNLYEQLESLDFTNKEKVLLIISQTIREETLKALSKI